MTGRGQDMNMNLGLEQLRQAGKFNWANVFNTIGQLAGSGAFK